MGNRAVITIAKEWELYGYGVGGLGIYLHWNGGRDSIEAFLGYCKRHRYSSLLDLYRVIANYSEGRSIYFDRLANLDCDNGDNGVYIIDTNTWEIIDRKYHEGLEQDEYDRLEMMLDIDKSQPENQQIQEVLRAEPIEVEDIKLGDTIINVGAFGEVESHTIIGFGEDRYVNGHNVKGLPNADRNGSVTPEDNINNYYLKDHYGQKRDYYKAK